MRGMYEYWRVRLTNRVLQKLANYWYSLLFLTS